MLRRQRYFRQRLKAAERERENVRDRYKFIIRKIYEAKWMVRKERDRECSARAKDVRGLSEDITNMRKEMESYQDEAGTDGSAFAFDGIMIISVIVPMLTNYLGMPLIYLTAASFFT